jgi:hypothetical protein
MGRQVIKGGREGRRRWDFVGQRVKKPVVKPFLMHDAGTV